MQTTQTAQSSPLTGSCHCGAVTVTLPPDAVGVVACHCADCQALHGNFFAMLIADRAVVEWDGAEHVRWYASSPQNERGFCVHCGSRLAKRPVEGSRVMVAAGLFGQMLGRRIIKNVWEHQKPDWYDLPRVGPPTAEELVALALAGPIETDLAQFGYAMRAASHNPAPPGVVALTWITARDPAERERIRAHSRQNVHDFLEEPGFISIVTGFTGLRGFTVTAWEDEDAMKRALGGHHATAMRELFAGDVVASVWTSVWTPARINRVWVRCTACAALEDVNDDHRQCARCNADLPPRPAFW